MPRRPRRSRPANPTGPAVAVLDLSPPPPMPPIGPGGISTLTVGDTRDGRPAPSPTPAERTPPPRVALPRRVVIVGTDPMSRSWVALELAAALATSRPAFSGWFTPTAAGDARVVVHTSDEIGYRWATARLAALAANHGVDVVTPGMWPTRVDQLVTARRSARAVLLDPLPYAGAASDLHAGSDAAAYQSAADGLTAVLIGTAPEADAPLTRWALNGAGLVSVSASPGGSLLVDLAGIGTRDFQLVAPVNREHLPESVGQPRRLLSFGGAAVAGCEDYRPELTFPEGARWQQM